MFVEAGLTTSICTITIGLLCRFFDTIIDVSIHSRHWSYLGSSHMFDIPKCIVMRHSIIISALFTLLKPKFYCPLSLPTDAMNGVFVGYSMYVSMQLIVEQQKLHRENLCSFHFCHSNTQNVLVHASGMQLRYTSRIPFF